MQANAQRGGYGSGSEDLEFPNIVKLNISALGAGGISLQYERFLKPKMSVCLGARYSIPRGIPGFVSTGISTVSTEFKFNSFAIAPEFRYYLGEGNGKGFYLGIFGKYDNITITAPYRETLNSGQTFDADFKGKISSFGPGLQLGSQFKLGDKVTLDWWITGPYYAIGKAYIGATSTNFGLSQADLTEINSTIGDDFNNPLFDFTKITVNNQEISLSSKLNSPRVRAGLAFGYRF
jgi:Protein of unknown function (DUF3575)